jgi:hypothetical protein
MFNRAGRLQWGRRATVAQAHEHAQRAKVETLAGQGSVGPADSLLCGFSGRSGYGPSLWADRDIGVEVLKLRT